jgi:hypothetical protein
MSSPDDCKQRQSAAATILLKTALSTAYGREHFPHRTFVTEASGLTAGRCRTVPIGGSRAQTTDQSGHRT